MSRVEPSLYHEMSHKCKEFCNTGIISNFRNCFEYVSVSNVTELRSSYLDTLLNVRLDSKVSVF